MQTEQKNIYIYNFPYPKVSSLNAANPSEHRTWGAHCSNSWDEQVPAKATAFQNREWGSWMAWNRERRGEGKGVGKRIGKEELVCAGGNGQLGHTQVSWWISFIVFDIFSVSFLFVLISPLSRSINGRKLYSSDCGFIRPVQSLQSTLGWPIVACGGASQSSHRQAGPAD